MTAPSMSPPRLWALRVAIVGVVAGVTALLIAKPWSHDFDRGRVRAAIRKALPAAAITDGPRVPGAQTLVVRVARGGVTEDVLVAIGDSIDGAPAALAAAEHQAGSGWGTEASGCGNWATAFRPVHGSPTEAGAALGDQVEAAIQRAAHPGKPCV
jgi:hypothetical protein